MSSTTPPAPDAPTPNSDAGSGPGSGPCSDPVLPAAEAAQRRDWPSYFDRMAGKPARETVKTAAAAFETPGLALDLGCGAGRDTQELLEGGWRVWACDASEDGLERLRGNPVCQAALEDGRLTVTLADFAAIAEGTIRLPGADLVNASFALPFCPPSSFAGLWAAIDAALVPGGRFSGQFFGERDSWAILEDRTHLTRAETLGLFEAYVLDSFKEEDRPSTQPGMLHKHWHVFHVVARKVRIR